MMFKHDDKDRSKTLKKAEEADLLEFCHQQGMTQEETEVFVRNSIKKLYEDEALD